MRTKTKITFVFDDEQDCIQKFLAENLKDIGLIDRSFKRASWFTEGVFIEHKGEKIIVFDRNEGTEDSLTNAKVLAPMPARKRYKYATNSEALPLTNCSASWPRGFSVTIGSRWQTKETPRLRGTLFAADVTENSVSLQLEETEDFRGGLASKLAWVSTAQDLAEKWECMPNAQVEARDL